MLSEIILSEINPLKHYTPREIFINGWLPWISNYESTYVLIKRDMKTKNLLKTTVIKGQKYNRYLIKGKNLKRFVAYHMKG